MDDGVQPDFYISFASLVQQVLPDLRAPDAGPVFLRAEELVNLFEELPAGQGVLIDQDTSVESVVVDFLGEPTKTAIGPVKLAARTGAAIVPMAMLMTDDGNYRIEMKSPVTINGGGSSLEQDVEKCSKAIEGFIQEEPSQWVWMHKRWKSLRSEMYC